MEKACISRSHKCLIIEVQINAILRDSSEDSDEMYDDVLVKTEDSDRKDGYGNVIDQYS